MIASGLLMALGFVILLLKLPAALRRKILGVDVYVDIMFSISLLGAFGSTYSGTTAAIVAGIAFSLCLFVIKKLQGYETLALSPRPHWASHKGIRK